jgi:hypothetical protein
MPAIFDRAGDELDLLGKVGEARITGTITDLHGAERNEPSRVKIRGDVQVLVRARFPRRSIWVVLAADDYDRAIEAHRLNRTVQAQGQLQSTSRRLELRANSFQVLG